MEGPSDRKGKPRGRFVVAPGRTPARHAKDKTEKAPMMLMREVGELKSPTRPFPSRTPPSVFRTTEHSWLLAPD